MERIPAEVADRVHELWDELADARGNGSDDPIPLLLGRVSELIDAQNAWWMPAIRVVKGNAADPIDHWRPGPIHYLHEEEAYRAFYKRSDRAIAGNSFDESVLANVRGAGSFRVNWLPELVSPEWYESPYYLEGFVPRGVVDSIFVASPVNPAVEVYMGFDRRGSGVPRFDPIAPQILRYALRGLRWFHRERLLEQGFLLARSAPTEAEQRVLRQLLTGASERKIATALGLALPTTHNHITTIYRKFGVRSRAGLMALWLGRGEPPRERTSGEMKQ